MKIRDDFARSQKIVKWKWWKNKVTKLISEAKSSYYTTVLSTCKSDPKCFWKIFNELVPRKSSPVPTSLKINDDLVYEADLIAEEFNQFFTDLPNQFQFHNLSSTGSFPDFSALRDFVAHNVPTNHYFEIQHLTPEFVLTELTHLKCTAAGLDDIGAKILKISAPVISPILSRIFNASICSSKFPERWKKAKVVCIHKAGDTSKTSNYRPISLLPLLSKVLERHIAISLNSYLQRFALLSDVQSGFRRNYSCETALLKLIQDCYDCLNKKELVGLVSLDFRKAFDLVSHPILLKKLQIYKFSCKSLDWFNSYLSERSQRVSFKNSLSTSKKIVRGVPQGSILGPLFFILFINDLVFSILESNKTLYADDCAIYSSNSSLDIVNSRLNRDVERILKWSSDNEMFIHIEKSYSMLICTRQKMMHLERKHLDISCGVSLLNNVSYHKHFGIVIDDRLSWSYHIRFLTNKLNLRVSVFSGIKKFLPFSARMNYYHAFIASHLYYACTVWSGTTSSNRSSLSTTLKRCAKSILDVDFYSSHKPLFKKLNWLSFDSHLSYRRCLITYQCITGLAPIYIQSMFIPVNSRKTHSMVSRTPACNLYVPKPNISLFKSSFAYDAAFVFNSLPLSAKLASSIKTFKRLVFQYLFSNPIT